MKVIKSTWVRTALVLFASATLFSFGSTKGGEGFEIYLNSKLLVQQFGKDVNTVKTIQLEQASANDELSIRYYHCGQAGKNRTVTIKDEQNKTLKEWHFADGPAAKAEMTCKVKDIFGLKKGTGTLKLNLYYSSSELPKGRQLASLVVASQNTARL